MNTVTNTDFTYRTPSIKNLANRKIAWRATVSAFAILAATGLMARTAVAAAVQPLHKINLESLALTEAMPNDQFLRETMEAVYKDNDQLQAARHGYRTIFYRNLQAYGQWLPNISLSANYSINKTENATSTTETKPYGATISVSQAIWRGNLLPGIKAAMSNDRAERSRLMQSEQNALLSAVTVYFALAQAQANRSLNVSNERVLAAQLDSVKQQKQLGTLTATDVSLAQATYEATVAQRLAADANLAIAEANYTQVVRKPIVQTPPVKLPDDLLPKTLDEAQELARKNNPLIRAAENDYDVADTQLLAAGLNLGPSASVSASYSWNYGSRQSSPNSGTQKSNNTQIMATVTLPLFDGGAAYANIGMQSNMVSQASYQLRAVRAQVEQQTIAAFNQLNSAKAQIKSLKSAIIANTNALEGTRQQLEIGTKTIIDLLTAEQQLLNAQVQLVQALYNEQLSAYQLLASGGNLTAATLKLSVTAFEP